MQRIDHHGIPLLWAEGPAPLTGALVLGVGARDETFRTTGVTHALEHLVCSTVPRSHLDHNAMVEASTTTFHATGRPHQVAEHLNRIAAALADLPLDRLPRELGVLAAEDGTSVHPALGFAAAVRYGPVGVGLVGIDGAPVDQLTAEQVLEHARRYAVRGNAVLVLTGPPPEGLDVRLPAGDRPRTTPRRPVDLPFPALLRTPELPVATLSFLVPDAPSAWLVAGLLVDALTEHLRHEQGVSYAVVEDHLALDDQVLFAVTADGRPEHAGQVAAAMWEGLGRLADEGPDPEELAHQVEGMRAAVDDPRSLPDRLAGAARELLLDGATTTDDELVAAAAGTTPEHVRTWARAARSSALLGVPAEAELDLPGLTDITDLEQPSSAQVQGERFGRKRLCLAPMDLAVHVGEAGLSLTAGGYTWGGAWDDVVGVARHGDDRGITLADGRQFHVCDRHVRDARRLAARIDELAGGLVFDVPADSFH